MSGQAEFRIQEKVVGYPAGMIPNDTKCADGDWMCDTWILHFEFDRINTLYKGNCRIRIHGPSEIGIQIRIPTNRCTVRVTHQDPNQILEFLFYFSLRLKLMHTFMDQYFF